MMDDRIIYTIIGFLLGFFINSLLTTHPSLFKNLYDKYLFKRHFKGDISQEITASKLQEIITKNEQEILKLNINFKFENTHPNSKIWDDEDEDYCIIGIKVNSLTYVFSFLKNDLFYTYRSINSGYFYFNGYFKAYSNGISQNSMGWDSMAFYYRLVPVDKP